MKKQFALFAATCAYKPRWSSLMKGLRGFLFILLLIVPRFASGQVSVNLVIRTPMPAELSTWERDRTIIQLVISNPDPQIGYNNAAVSFTVLDESGRQVVGSRDGSPAIPRFTIPPSGTVTRYGPDFVSRDAVTLDPAIERTATTTGRLPEGSYQFCVRLLDQNGVEIASTGASCRSFTILIPDPPTLIAPEDRESLSSEYPLFQWTPVYISPGVQSQYRLIIAPIYEGQTSRDAIERSTPLYDQRITTTSLTYPASAPRFSMSTGNRGFAWQVQAVDNLGNPVARNDGRSEIRTFNAAGSGEITLENRYPVNGETIPWIPPHLVVRFAPYADDITQMEYTLTLTGGGRTFTNSRTLRWPSGPRISQGVPDNERAQHIIVDITGPDGWADWASGLQKGVDYRWSVQATFQKGTRSITTTSTGTTFRLGMNSPALGSPANGERLMRGASPDLTWNPQRPAHLNPPDLLGISRGASGMTFGAAYEMRKLEVSRESDFRSTLVSNIRSIPATGNFVTGESADSLWAPDRYEMESLRDTGIYYWRVSYLRDDRTAYQTGPTWNFVIGDTGTTTVARRDTTGPCSDDCSIPAPTNTTVSSRTYREGDSLQIGRFTLRLGRVSGSAGGLSGEGTIQIPVFRAPVMVEFSSIRINSDNRVFEGRVTGKQADGSPISPTLANQLGTELGLTNEQVSAIHGFASQAERLVSAFTGMRPVGLPIGFDNMVEGERVVLAILGLVFSPTDARLNAAMAFPLPFLGPGVGLGLGARDICFHPGGLGGDGRGQLYLAADLGYRQPDTWSFLFKAPTVSDSGTYVAWDCRGFLELRLKAEVEFPRDWLKPSPDDGSLSKASFYTTIRRGGDFLVAATMNRCEITGAPGFIMEIQEMAFDHSEARNPEGIVFPTGFTGSTDNTWKGFFIRRAAVSLPPELRTFEEGRPPMLAVTNLMIGGGGFTASFRAENIIQYPFGNFGEWGASIDTIAIDFVSSSLTRGMMNGRIKIPVTDSALIYQAVLSRPESGSGVDFEFSIRPGDTINANLWSARLSLNPTSRIALSVVSGSFQASATLSGALTLEGDVGEIRNLGFRGVRFENFRVMTNSPYIETGTWSFASEQRSMSGFPVSINNIGIVGGDRGGRPGIGLQFTLAVNLQPGSSTISGATTLSIWGRLGSGSGAQSFEFAGIDLDSIGIDADLGAVQIFGGVRFYRGDATFGDGFRGELRATFVRQVTVGATIQFGTVRSFRYWYVDAKVLFNPGIPVFSGVGIYGFGGGAWYHMRRDGSDPSMAEGGTGSGASGPGATNSGYRFIPDDGVEFGFRAMVVMGTHPSPEGFNADVAFEAEFIRGGGIGRISILGSGYMMAGINNRSEAKVVMNVDLTFNFPEETFHGVFDVRINADPFTGGGRMVMHFEPTTWYVKVGTPRERINLNLANWLRIDAYLMMGQGLDFPMDLPPEVTSILGPMPVTRNPSIERGDGFAFGASANIDTGRLQFLIFYARIAAGLGFDIALLNFGPQARCDGVSGTMGINGWYAMGQIYAYIDASVGIFVDLWFTSGEFEILRVGVAAALRAGAPNPTWLAGAVAGRYSILGGAISGNCRFEFKVGEECLPVTESPLARMDLVSDIRPTDGSTNVDVFVEPQAAFNFEVNRPFELRDVGGDGEERVRTFRVKVRNFTFDQVDPRQTVPGTWNVSSDAVQATYSPRNVLAGYTRYNATVSAYGEEYISGSWRPAERMEGGTIEQTATTTFTTGGAPTNIPERNVAFSYPLNRQRFFLQDECADGMVMLKMGQPELFAPRDGYRVTFLARFIPTFGGADVEVPAFYNSGMRMVSFAMPRISNNTIYALQIVRKEESATRTGFRDIALPTEIADSRVVARATMRSVYSRSLSTVQLNTRRLPGNQVKRGEKLLYLYYFKSSQYSRLTEKLATLTSQTGPASPPLGNFQLLTARFSGPEMFDVYDIEGLEYTRDGRDQRMRGLVGLTAATRTDTWHRRFTNPWVYDAIERMRRMGAWSGNVEWELYARGAGARQFAQYTSTPRTPLQDWEIGPQSRSSSPLFLSGTTMFSVPGSSMRSVGRITAVPGLSIQYNHGIVVPFDYTRLRQRAAWYLSMYGGEFISAEDERWLRGILAKSYERPSRGTYTLQFYYRFCEDPDGPVRYTKLFTY